MTLGGAVARPGVHEVPLGASLPDVISACGGLAGPISAYLVGGYFGGWVAADAAHSVQLTPDAAGAGAIVALPASTCPAAECARVVRDLSPTRAPASADRACTASPRSPTPLLTLAATARGRPRALDGDGRRPRRLPPPRRSGAVRAQRARASSRRGLAQPRAPRGRAGRSLGARPPRLAARGRALSPLRLRIDPIACDGHGLCAELFPERIALDDWGYPILDPAPIPRSLEKAARQAAAECPTCALLLVPAEGCS